MDKKRNNSGKDYGKGKDEKRIRKVRDADENGSTGSRDKRVRSRKKFPDKSPNMKTNKSRNQQKDEWNENLVRLNKYIANSGICSRREADKLIEAGAIKVNGNIVTRVGTKVRHTDKVQYGDQTLAFEKPVYLLLNKPKGYITTTDDPFERKTVMDFVINACKERIYPVGRLDRNTSGLLMFTNDGELAKKLIHPKHKVKKVYHVVLNKALTKTDMMSIVKGVELDDGIADVDKIAYIDNSSKNEVGIEIHSGKNRVIRRIFESLGYEVIRLDRTMFAGLTKKDLPRGKWRFLKSQEINMLKRV